MIDSDTTAKVSVRLSVELNAEQLGALIGDSAGLAIIRLEGAFEHAMRKQLREQLRSVVSQLGGDPFQYHLRAPSDDRQRPDGLADIKPFRAKEPT